MRHLVIFILLYPSIFLGQTTFKGVIVSEDTTALPFTNIAVLTGSAGAITNEAGEFTIANVSRADSLKISNIAYFPRIVAMNDLSCGDTIVLVNNIQQLPGIKVMNLSGYQSETNLGFHDYPNNGTFQLLPGNQLAIYIENDDQREGWIKGIYFRVKSLGKCNNSLRVRLLELDSLTSGPGGDLLREQVVIHSANLKKRNYVDLSDYKIMLPKEGVYVVLEWLYPNHDCTDKSYTTLVSNTTTPHNLVWFNFRDKAWTTKFRPRLNNGNYNNPNVGLKVAYISVRNAAVL